ncbi:RNA polymerase sigma factor [Novipirellula artificiosorum]|uniref:ECF RNA polymerase sigma factor SigL n=1 Tax=Novipirellula artificiosorum TaxID=2528016 RepID=A0A5C6E196_9BACT|nr:sigma-70 family RNA polymerase sigma factor [Novipirellula artificiosorum]TWU42244.1 ECF RNA polymerase sigma factor SigL [Novipirellula artificiosorum]
MSGLPSRLADDEPSAWAELYDATADGLFQYVTVLAGDPDAAAEIFQEGFVRLYRSRERLREVDDLKAFVFTVIRNETNRWLSHKQKRMAETATDEPLAESVVHSDDDDTELIRHALKTLSEEEQELIELKVYAQLTFTQISKILRLPSGTCASRYRRSLAKMRLVIQEQIG